MILLLGSAMNVQGIVFCFSTKTTGLFSSKTSVIFLALTWHYTGYRICFHLPISICLEIKNDWSYTLLPLTFMPSWCKKGQLYSSHNLPQEVRKCLERLLLQKPSHVFDSMRHRQAYKTYSELQNVICLDRIHMSKSDRQTLSANFFQWE